MDNTDLNNTPPKKIEKNKGKLGGENWLVLRVFYLQVLVDCVMNIFVMDIGATYKFIVI